MSKFNPVTIVDALFVIRLVPLILAGFISTRSKDFIGMLICLLYICVTTVNYFWAIPSLNAIFSTPLVYLTCWYIIKPDVRNRRNQRLKFKPTVKKIKLIKEK